MYACTCDTSQKFGPIVARPTSASGRPAQIQGALRVTVQNGDGTVEQDPERPLEFYVVSGDAPGLTTYLVEADADLGEGERLIQDTVELTVTSETAQSFGLTGGTAVPKDTGTGGGTGEGGGEGGGTEGGGETPSPAARRR